MADKIAKLEANLEKEVLLKTEVCGGGVWRWCVAVVLGIYVVLALSVCLFTSAILFEFWC